MHETFTKGPHRIDISPDPRVPGQFTYTHATGGRTSFTIPITTEQYERTVLQLVVRGYVVRTS